MQIIPTMKSGRPQVLALILAGLILLPAYAEVIPGRWEKVSNMEFGTPITVELKNGDRVVGQFEGLSATRARDKLRHLRVSYGGRLKG